MTRFCTSTSMMSKLLPFLLSPVGSVCRLMSLGLTENPPQQFFRPQQFCRRCRCESLRVQRCGRGTHSAVRDPGSLCLKEMCLRCERVRSASTLSVRRIPDLTERSVWRTPDEHQSPSRCAHKKYDGGTEDPSGHRNGTAGFGGTP